MPKYTVGLSAREFRKLADQIHDYRTGLQKKCEEFTRRLAEEGVAIAKANILAEDAVYTGELLNSINLQAGEVVFCGSKYYVYTDCPWAKFVEFGTGITGSANPHPDTSIAGWIYDINKKQWKGMPSRPFMYNTAQALKTDSEKIMRIAKEVFGND